MFEQRLRESNVTKVGFFEANWFGEMGSMESPFLISLIFVKFETNFAKSSFNFYHFHLLKILRGRITRKENVLKM